MGIGREFLRGSASSFLLLSAGKLLAFGSQLLLARWLTVKGYGILSYVLTIVTLLSLLGSLGIHTTIVRFVSSLNARSDWDKLKGVLIYSGRLLFISSIAVAACSELAVYVLTPYLEPSLRISLQLGLLLIPLTVLSGLRQQALRGLKKIAASQVPEAIVLPLVVIAGVVLLQRSEISNAAAAVLLQLGAVFAAFVCGGYLLSRALPGELKQAVPCCDRKEILSSSLPLVAVVLSQQIIGNTDFLILGYFGSMAEVGLFSAITRLSSIVSFGLAVVNVIAAPMISEHYSKGNKKGLDEIVVLTAIGSTGFAVIVAFAFFMQGGFFLQLFGKEFSAGLHPLWIVTAGDVINCMAGPVGVILLMAGFEKEVSRALIATALFNIVLSLCIIPLYKVQGAAAAKMATTIVWNAWLGALVYRRIGINPTIVRRDLFRLAHGYAEKTRSAIRTKLR